MAITSISNFDASGLSGKLDQEKVTKKDIHEIKEYLTQLTDEIRYELQHVSEAELQIPTKLSDLENDAGYCLPENMPKELMLCIYGKTTYDEITAALNAGKLPICYAASDEVAMQSTDFAARMFIFTDKRTNGYYYFQTLLASSEQWIYCRTDSTWYTNKRGLEYSDRMSTSVSVSSTDSQYPTAKATYDAIYGATHYVVGDVADLSGAICSCYITGAAKRIDIFVPTAKDASAVGWNVTAMKGGIRTPMADTTMVSDGTTASDSSNWLTGSNIEGVACTGRASGIVVQITGNSAFTGGSISNNMVLSYRSTTLTFSAINKS